MNNTDWLANLKAGDKVIVGKYTGLCVVHRTTPTQIIVGNARYRKSDGRRVGQGDCGFKLLEATPERIAEIQERCHREVVLVEARAIKFRSLTTDQLERIVAIAKEGEID